MANFSTSQNNSRDNEINVNTRGIAFYNKDGFDPSTMNVGFWNDGIVVKIHPALPKDKQTQSRVYDYDKEVRVTLTTTTAKLLLEAVKTGIIPAIESEEDHSIGVQIGGDSMICVGTGKKQTGEIRPFVSIHKAINSDSRKPELTIYYEFNHGQIINDYNEDTGTVGSVDKTNTELLIFLASLDAAISALTKADVHATRTVMRAFNEKLMNSVVAIGEKVGADIPSGGSNKSYGSGARVDWTGCSSSTANESKEAESAFVGSIGDINELMG